MVHCYRTFQDIITRKIITHHNGMSYLKILTRQSYVVNCKNRDMRWEKLKYTKL